jgi:heat shock protein HslJ
MMMGPRWMAVLVVLAFAVTGCGSTNSSAGSGTVTVVVTSPTGGGVIAADNVTVRGTVNPPNATVQVQGRPAAVGNGVFTGTATLHGGRTTIDVIGSASGATPGSTSITVTRQSSRDSKGSQHSSGRSASPTTTVVRTVSPPSQPAAPSVASTGRAFYAPSGNVSCSMQTESAQCSVASANLTFVIPRGGGSAYEVSGLSVPRGTGSEAPFGTEMRSEGVIVCDIPPSSTPAGITCHDTASGHGFQASRVAARQSVY